MKRTYTPRNPLDALQVVVESGCDEATFRRWVLRWTTSLCSKAMKQTLVVLMNRGAVSSVGMDIKSDNGLSAR